MRKVLLATALFSVAAFAGEWTGVISEDHCGAKHSTGSDADQKCVQDCLKGGAKPVFVTGGKVYKIDDASKVTELAGHKVVLKGTLEGDTVKVDSVQMAKK